MGQYRVSMGSRRKPSCLVWAAVLWAVACSEETDAPNTDTTTQTGASTSTAAMSSASVANSNAMGSLTSTQGAPQVSNVPTQESATAQPSMSSVPPDPTGASASAQLTATASQMNPRPRPTGGFGMPSASAPDIEPPPDAGAPEPSDGGMSVEPGIDPEPGKLAGITAEHNLLRAMIDHGDPLPPLVWDEDIAAIAQAYAEELAGSCGGLVHSMTPGLGENLAFFGTSSANSMYGSGVESADSWYSEGACYIYAPIGETDCDPSCDEFQQFGTCGHYTQVVWRESERLGCGVASCFDGQLYRDYYVCNYDPPGNYYGQYPY